MDQNILVKSTKTENGGHAKLVYPIKLLVLLSEWVWASFKTKTAANGKQIILT